MINSVIHAGGKGTRLRESIKGPKALAPVDDHPLLWYHLKPLTESKKINKYIFTLMNDHKIIQRYLNTYAASHKLNISTIVEPRPLGRAGSIRLGIEEGLIDVDLPCLMSHPDDLIPINIKNLLDYAEESTNRGKSLILVMAKNTDPNTESVTTTYIQRCQPHTRYISLTYSASTIENHILCEPNRARSSGICGHG